MLTSLKVLWQDYSTPRRAILLSNKVFSHSSLCTYHNCRHGTTFSPNAFDFSTPPPPPPPHPPLTSPFSLPPPSIITHPQDPESTCHSSPKPNQQERSGWPHRRHPRLFHRSNPPRQAAPPPMPTLHRHLHRPLHIHPSSRCRPSSPKPRSSSPRWSLLYCVCNKRQGSSNV